MSSENSTCTFENVIIYKQIIQNIIIGTNNTKYLIKYNYMISLKLRSTLDPHVFYIYVYKY